MNKKVSTILTLSLMLGGSLLSSSAFAQAYSFGGAEWNLKEDVSDNATVVLAQDWNSDKYAVGLYEEDSRDAVVTPKVVRFGDALENGTVLENYLWRVKVYEPEVTGGIHSYQFINVATGDTLKFNKTTNAFVSPTETEEAYKAGGVYKTFTFGSPTTGAAYDGTSDNQLFAIGAPSQLVAHLSDATPDVAELVANQHPTESYFFKMYSEVSDEADQTLLNSLFNRKGFSFEVNQEVEENIFANRIKAINVTKTVSADNTESGFPEGVYFATSTPAGDFDNTASDAEKYEYLSQCTFIAVASNDCIELSGLDRANGQGFELIQVKGSDFDHYIGNVVSEQASNDEISVWNACFTVNTKKTESFPFSVRLKKFYYVANEETMATEMAAGRIYRQEEASVNLTTLQHGSPRAWYLTTSVNTSSAAPFIFCFDDSNAISGISLLKTDRTAAVYNIRFVSGADDNTELNKYLTVGDVDGDSAGNDFGWVAKGEAYADAEALATPAYQFVITSVNGNNITFTNRESGKSFTTQLFEEREQNGLKVYSIGSTATENVSIVNVKVNSYATTVDEDATTLDQTEIQLIPSSVDSYAGFLNVEDETLMTMKFARDVNTTSNLWYAAVSNDYKMTTSSNAAILTDDLYSGAAQWQLKEVGEEKLRRDFVYNSSNSVTEIPFGDVVAAKTYVLQYVTDGSETGYYLTSNSGIYSVEEVSEDNATKYIIRENPDGSVQLISDWAGNWEFSDNKKAFDYNVNESGRLTLSTTTPKYYYYTTHNVYDVELNDNELLTYLVNESADISWPGEEGHVTIQSAGGDYLTIDTDNNDAIIIDEANADPFYLHVTDKNAIVPSFYISKGMGEGSTAESERMFLFNPQDSITYQVNMDYDPKYQMSEETVKAVFKSGIMDESRDTLALTVKGEVDKLVAVNSNNQNVWGGLNRFKFQIIETTDGNGYYNIRQIKAGRTDVNKELTADNTTTYYLANINDNAVWVTKSNKSVPRYEFAIESIDAPTANESVSATEVKVVAYDGAINIKNAAGKNVVVSTILGQIVANEVLTSDNATISVPAGIAIVSVDGEEAVKVSVK